MNDKDIKVSVEVASEDADVSLYVLALIALAGAVAGRREPGGTCDSG